MSLVTPTLSWSQGQVSDTGNSVVFTLPSSGITSGALIIVSASIICDTATYQYPSSAVWSNSTGVTSVINSGQGWSAFSRYTGHYIKAWTITTAQHGATLTISDPSPTSGQSLAATAAIYTGAAYMYATYTDIILDGTAQAGWDLEKFPQMTADATSSGLFCLFAFGHDATNSTGTFATPGTGWQLRTQANGTRATGYNGRAFLATWDNPVPTVGSLPSPTVWATTFDGANPCGFQYDRHIIVYGSTDNLFNSTAKWSEHYTITETTSWTAAAQTPLADFRASSSLVGAADTATPFADLTYTLPTGAATGDLLLALYGGKPFDTLASTPSTYTATASFASGTTANSGAGVGSTRAQAFHKTHSGTESNPVSSFTAQYNPGSTAMLALSKSQAGSWSVYSSSGGDDTPAGNNIDPVFNDFLPAVEGDILVIQMVIPDDTGDSTTITSIDIPGCTLNTPVQRLVTASTTAGNDLAMQVWTVDVIGGSATDVPTLSATTGTAGDAAASINLILAGPPGVGTRPPTTKTTSALATTVSPTTSAVGGRINATTAVNTTVAPTPAATAIETLFTTAGPNNNLVNNSSFETDVSGWAGTGSSNATLAQTSAVAFSGTKAAALTATLATGGIRMATTTDPQVTAGVTYTLSAYMRAAALATTADVGIAFYDAAGVIIGALTYGTAVTTTTTTWTRATYTVTAPAGAVTASLSARPRNTATSTIGEVQYVDAVQFEVAGAATAYVAPTQTTVFPTPTAAGAVSTIQFGTATTTTVTPTPAAAATVTKPVTGLATTTSPTPAAAGTPAKTGIGLNTLADTVEAAAGVTDHIATTTATVNPTPASAGVVTDSGAATATISPTPAANSTASRPLTGTQTLADTAEAAAGTVTKSTSAVAVTVAPIPAGNAVTDHIATTVTITTSPSPAAALGAKTIPATATTSTVSPTPASALGAVTHTVTGTATTSPTTVAAGVVGDEGTAAVTTTPTTAAAGVVLDEGTAATTTTPTTAAAGTVTDLGDATSTVTVTPVVSPQAMAKTTLATMVTSSPATTAIPAGTLKSSTAAVTVTPNSTWSGNAWGSQFMRPDVLLSVVGLTGIVEYIQDSPSTPDTNELAPTGGAVDVRFSFENHDQQLRALPNDQTIRVRLTSV